MVDCDECGLVSASIPVEDVPNALIAFGPMYRARLDADPAILRSRPSPDVWSALEYACHVRDVLEVQRDRLLLALAEDRPTFVPMGRDERVGRSMVWLGRHTIHEGRHHLRDIDAALG